MKIIQVQNVVKRFGDYAASNNISFDVDQGSIFGLIGPNGAGKTTMIRMINNILFPDEGKIFLFGEPQQLSHQNQMGYLPEERGLYKKIKVLEQIIYFGQLKGLSRSEAQTNARFWLKNLDASDWENKKIEELSKGMQQKVQFITTILHNPKLLILDEPFSGFDPINADLLKSIILDLKSKGTTIILSTHIMEQAEQLCDDICLVNKGKKVLDGSIRDIKSGYGRDTILLEFEGDDSFISDIGDLKIINKTQNRVEFRYDSTKISLNDIMLKVMNKVQIDKLEVSAPSLHEIFIDVVSKQEVTSGI